MAPGCDALLAPRYGMSLIQVARVFLINTRVVDKRNFEMTRTSCFCD